MKPGNKRARAIIGRVLTALFFAALAFLLFRHARNVQWNEVWSVIRSYDLRLLAGVVALTAASFLLYASYDVLARGYTAHGLGTRRVLLVAAVSYACNLNLGALVGGAGFRFRLYTRSGLEPGTVARILAFSVTTNWLGYVALGGAVLASGAIEFPMPWAPGTVALRVLGFALLALVVGYLVACGVWHERTWTVRGHEIRWPGLWLAVLQLLVSTANWLTMALIVYLLLRARVAYPTVLASLLLAAVTGAMTHVPAGLGVIELVMLAMLDDLLPRADILAALLAYRGIYYIAPLLLALMASARLEAKARQSGSASGADPSTRGRVSGRPWPARRA